MLIGTEKRFLRITTVLGSVPSAMVRSGFLSIVSGIGRVTRSWRLRGLAAHPTENEAAEAAALEALWDDLGTERALAIAEEAGGSVARRVGELLGILAD